MKNNSLPINISDIKHPFIKTELLLTVLLNVFLVATFIIFFYFTIGVQIEKKMIDNQMVYLSNNLYDTITLLGPDSLNSFKNIINNVNIDDTEKNSAIEQQNNDIKNKSMSIYSIFASVILLILGYLSYIHRKDLKFSSILKNNILLFIFIMAIYTIFLEFFSSKYLSVDPNKVKLALIYNMKKYNLI
jgi:hypothetical protein